MPQALKLLVAVEGIELKHLNLDEKFEMLLLRLREDIENLAEVSITKPSVRRNVFPAKLKNGLLASPHGTRLSIAFKKFTA